MLPSKIYKRLDHLGIGVALLCAVHCALLPFVITILPIIGLKFLADPVLENSIILISFIMGLLSIGNSWKMHRKILPAVILILGFILIMTGHFTLYEEYEWVWLALGGGLVATAHFVNWMYTGKACHPGSRLHKSE